MTRRTSDEDAVLVWLLDENQDRPEINREILKSIIADVRIFREPSQCLQCLSALHGEQLFVVLGRERTPFIQQLDEFDWILCIYLQGPNDEYVDSEGASKVRGFNLDESELFVQLAGDVIVFKRSSTHLTIYSSAAEASSQIIQQHDGRFMWSQMLFLTILNIPAQKFESAQTSHKDVIEECLRFYQGDEYELNRINGFGCSYTPSKAIYWYTLDTFLYRVLNRALRTQNILIIYKFRFILQDIYQQLKEAWQTQHRTQKNDPPIIVYRGQLITFEEVKAFKRNIGELVVLTSFFSTTTDLPFALALSGQGQQRPQLESVIFEIILDTSSIALDDLVPFADITHLSSKPEEQETLLRMGSIMRIESIRYDSANKVEWIRLRLCSYNNSRFTELNGFCQFHLLGMKYNEPGLIMNLANILEWMGESEKAMSMSVLAKKRATEIGAPDPVVDATHTIHQMIQLEARKGHVSEKMESYCNQIAIDLKAVESQAHGIPEADYLINIMKGLMDPFVKFLSLKDVKNISEDPLTDPLDDLVNNFDKPLEQIAPWVQSFLPANHPLQAQLLFFRGIQQSINGQHAAADEQLQAALNRFDSNGYRNHPERYRSLKMMALNAMDCGNEDRALDLYLQMLDFHDSSLIRDADNRAKTNLEIARLLEKRGHSDAAVDYYTNIIEMPHISPWSYHIQEALRRRADLYKDQKKWSASLADYLRLREIQQRNRDETSGRDMSHYLDTYTIPMLRKKIQENSKSDT